MIHNYTERKPLLSKTHRRSPVGSIQHWNSIAHTRQHVKDLKDKERYDLKERQNE